MFVAAQKSLAVFTMDARGTAAFLLLAIMLVALLEMLSIGLIIPVIQSVVFGAGDNRIAAAYVYISDSLGLSATPTTAATIFSAMFVVKNIAILGLSFTIARVVNLRAAAAKRKLFERYLSESLDYHAHLNSAEILRNVQTGCGQAFEAARLTFVMLLELLLSIAALALLMLIEPIFTLAVGGVLTTGAVVFYLLTSRYFRFWGQKALELEAIEIRWINQALGDLRFAKIVGAINGLAARLYSVSRPRAIYESQATTAILVPRLYLETLAVLGFLFVAGYALALGKPMAELAATTGVFVLVALRLLPSMNRILTGAAEIRKRSPFIELIHHDLGVSSKTHAVEYSPMVISTATMDTITLRKVSHTYRGATAPALSDINLTIYQGESIGIVGSSGAGKTSLVDIITGLVEPTSGDVLINATPFSASERLSRRLVGYVPQESYLMDGTLRENIAYTIDDAPLNSGRVVRAVEMTGLNDLVDVLPDGLDTELGERGTRLSGGQRQRVAIARALYCDPEILVFDEATAALDNESEHLISRALADLAGRKTVITIAHRLSTIKNCDRIVFMRAGQIDDIGRFEDLQTRCPSFRKLVKFGDLSSDNLKPRR